MRCAMFEALRLQDTYNDSFEYEAPEQPRCQGCGAFLAWKHDHTRQPTAGVTQYVWACRKCGGVNVLAEDVSVAAQAAHDGDDLPF